MTKNELISRMNKHENEFDILWLEIVNDINQYLEDNPEENNFYPFLCTQIDKFIDSLCLSGAWIHDKLNRKEGLPCSTGYKGSKTQKIRKALGYNE